MVLRTFLLLCTLILPVVFADKNQEIVIIGAGASGIAAASRLIQNGFKNVTLLEAEDRFGGRVNTVPFADGFVDIGAQWCHGEKGNPSFELGNPLDLLAPSILSTKNLRFGFPNGNQIPVDEGLEQFRLLLGVTSDPTLNTYQGFVGDFITDNYKSALLEKRYSYMTSELEAGFLRYYRNFVLARTAMESLNDDNGPGFVAYDECEGNQMLSWKGKGYGMVLKVLMKLYPDPAESLRIEDKIVLNTEVSRIYWAAGNGVEVVTSDGRRFSADRVIFTPSLGVLKERHEKLFRPALSGKKRDAIHGLSMGAVAKVYLRFEAPFWEQGWGGVHILWDDQAVQQLQSDNSWLESVMAFLTVDGQPSTLCAWIAGASVGHVERANEQFVVTELIKLLESLVPQLNVPKPVEVRRTQWLSNPHFRGTYSFRGINATALGVSPRDLEQPLTDESGRIRVQFAGEATNFNHYSTVHGAIETGWREAQRIIDEENLN